VLVAAVALVVAGCGASQGPAERAALAASEGRWDAAYDDYARAVGREPSRLDVRRERVRAAQRSGRLAELLAELRRRADSDEAPPAVAYELALAEAIGGEPGSDGRALELLRRVADRLPGEADVHYRIGLVHLEREEATAAAAPLERAVELDPRVVRFRVALAGALAQITGREDEARRALAELPRLEPTADEVSRGIAILSGLNNPVHRVPLALRETYRDAVGALAEEDTAGQVVQLVEEALEAAPTSAPFLVLDGLASVRLGQLGPARALFLRAIELWPGDPTPWLELASLDEEAGDMAAAEEHVGRALAVDPLSLDGWAELGRIRYQRQRFVEAAEAFTALLRIDGGLTLTHLWLGRSLRRAGRDEEAERIYLSMLEQHPRNYEACLQLGHIYRARRVETRDRSAAAELRTRALSYYRQALDVRPQDPLVQRLVEALEGGQ
jgi:tetratricopeptide (TPR) repeat protein